MRFDDDAVGVDERKLEHPREPPADATLAGRGRPDEHHRRPGALVRRGHRRDAQETPSETTLVSMSGIAAR